MSAQPARERPAPRPQTPEVAECAVAPGSEKVQPSMSDAHRWLEGYRAAHAGAGVPEQLAGVPLN